MICQRAQNKSVLELALTYVWLILKPFPFHMQPYPKLRKNTFFLISSCYMIIEKKLYEKVSRCSSNHFLCPFLLYSKLKSSFCLVLPHLLPLSQKQSLLHRFGPIEELGHGEVIYYQLKR